jgi:hypothetical protein
MTQLAMPSGEGSRVAKEEGGVQKICDTQRIPNPQPLVGEPHSDAIA